MLAKPPRGSSARRDLKRASSRNHRQAVRRKAARQIIGWKEEASARSARTRRPVGGSRARPGTAGVHGLEGQGTEVHGIEQGNIEKWCLIEHRDISVKHTTSPSRRGCPRQVAVSRYVKFSRLRPKPKPFSVAPRTSTRLSSTRSLLRLRRCGCRWLSRISLVREARHGCRA